MARSQSLEQAAREAGRVRELAKAGALIAAEIDRIIRANKRGIAILRKLKAKGLIESDQEKMRPQYGKAKKPRRKKTR